MAPPQGGAFDCEVVYLTDDPSTFPFAARFLMHHFTDHPSHSRSALPILV